MALLDTIKSASSIAPITNPANPVATIFVAPTSPEAIMGNASDSAAAPERSSLRYPIDSVNINHFMSFSIYKYSRQSLNDLGTYQPLTQGINNIVLPMSESLIDTQHEQYDSHAKVGTVVGGAMNAIAPEINEFKNGNVNGSVLGLLGGVAGLSGVSSLISAFTQYAGGSGSVVGGSLATGASAMLGLTPNQFFTVLFVGPEYKRHRFTWNLSPRNFQEAEELRLIIKTFKNRMAPRRTAGGLIWAFPRIFKIAIYNNSKYMYKFKPAVLETFTVNYTPGGRASFHRGSVRTGDDSTPEGVTIQAQFLELEYWLDGNITDSNNPFDVYHEELYDGPGADFLNNFDVRKALTDFVNNITEEGAKLLGTTKAKLEAALKSLYPGSAP